MSRSNPHYIGERIHNYTLLSFRKFTTKNGSKTRLWTCKCDCGNTFEINVQRFLWKKSCGCINGKKVYQAKNREVNIEENKKYIGKKFGALTITDVGYGKCSYKSAKHEYLNFTCKCDCGNTVIYPTFGVLDGSNTSCGCKITRKSDVGAKNKLYRGYKRSAGYKGLEFTLTEDQFYEIVAKDCHYCGVAPKQVSKKSKYGQFLYNGIDRADNNLGYVYENCVPCCRPCNIRKLTMSEQGFYNWIEKVYNHCKDRIRKDQPEYSI